MAGQSWANAFPETVHRRTYFSSPSSDHEHYCEGCAALACSFDDSARPRFGRTILSMRAALSLAMFVLALGGSAHAQTRFRPCPSPPPSIGLGAPPPSGAPVV